MTMTTPAPTLVTIHQEGVIVRLTLGYTCPAAAGQAFSAAAGANGAPFPMAAAVALRSGASPADAIDYAAAAEPATGWGWTPIKTNSDGWSWGTGVSRTEWGFGPTLTVTFDASASWAVGVSSSTGLSASRRLDPLALSASARRRVGAACEAADREDMRLAAIEAQRLAHEAAIDDAAIKRGMAPAAYREALAASETRQRAYRAFGRGKTARKKVARAQARAS